MKNFNQLRKDFVGDQELADVLNGCTDVDDIKKGFAEKGYEVTDKDLDEFVEEKLPLFLEEYPQLKEQLDANPELNGAVDVRERTATTGCGAVIGGFLGMIGGPLGILVGSTVGSVATNLATKNC